MATVDAVEYARRALADSPLYDGHLDIQDIRLAPGLPHLQHLTSLGLQFALHDGGLTFTQALTGLTALDLSSTPTTPPLGDLTDHPSLENLDLGRYPTLPNLEPLRRLPALHYLGLWKCGQLAHATSFTEPLTALRQLQNISFTDVDGHWLCNQLLPTLPALTQLDLRQRHEPIAIASLADALENHPMTGIYLFGGNLPDDLELLSCWADTLTSLNLASSPIQDLRFIQPLRQLEFLNLADTAAVDLSPLRGLTNLTTLQLNHMKQPVDRSSRWARRSNHHYFIATPDHRHR